MSGYNGYYQDYNLPDMVLPQDIAIINHSAITMAITTGAGDAGLVRDFAITMAAAGVVLVLFRQFKQPPVLGYLLAGLILGPFTLPSPPVQNEETIRLLADLGLILLLFGVGLEFGWQRIRQIGSRVILIAAIEISFMFALGYEIAILLGWTGKEGLFLGAALSISSSAILVKILRDTGSLHQIRGRLIVGILVVEDFAAVILLTVLSGIATTGTANFSDAGLLITKLAIFGIAALGLGALLAPRLIRFVSRYESDETLLITSLALCFGLALTAQQLGLSAAVGAFVIGMVLGDTEQSGAIHRIISPVRDVFAALFFVSIGMLIDLFPVTDFIVPTLIISGVFIAGKILAGSIGTFLAGHDGRTALNVGMGMPQTGEFSLAMAKVGVDQGAVGSFFYPAITVSTAIVSLVYPIIFRSADGVSDFLARRSPKLLRQYVENLTVALATMRWIFSFKSRAAKKIQHSGHLILINLGIIIILIAIGTAVLQYTQELSDFTHLRDSLIGLVIGGAVLALCIPPAVAIWRSLQTLTDGVSQYILRGQILPAGGWGSGNLRVVLRDSILIIILFLPAVWSLPLISQLLSLGSISAPIPAIILIGLVTLTARTAFQIHKTLEHTFQHTFLGHLDTANEEEENAPPDAAQKK
jgi:CPA2 family monovalent cation:H+ antiporter-2